jgi:hypothetical protein
MTGVWTQLTKTLPLIALATWGCQSTAQVGQQPQTPKSGKTAEKSATPQAPASSASETQWPMMGGWHHHSPYGQLYFQGKSVTVEGEITRTATLAPFPHMTQGIQIVLKTREGEKNIHLGPAWYINQQEFTLNSGEKIKVEGRSVVIAGQSVVMANSVQKGSERLVLRDENGFPYWAGKRMMRPQ